MRRRAQKPTVDYDELINKINEANIEELDIDNDIIENSFIVLFGRRGSGKSFLGRRIMKRFSDIPKIKIVCPSEVVNGDYGKHIPGICIDDDFKSSALEEIFLDQEEIINAIGNLEQTCEKYKEKIKRINAEVDKYATAIEKNRVRKDEGLDYIKKLNLKIDGYNTAIAETKTKISTIDPRVLYVADDIMFKKESPLLDEQFRKLVFNGRHYKITGLYMSQYPLGVPKNMRGCIDYVFILAEDSESSRELLYDNYGKGIFSNKYLFYAIMDQCTTDRRALVLKLTKTSADGQTTEVAKTDIDRMKGKVFWYRADGIGDFKWKNEFLWQLHNAVFDKDYRKRAIDSRRAELATKGLNLPKKKECGINIRLKTKTYKDDESDDVKMLTSTTTSSTVQETVSKTPTANSSYRHRKNETAYKTLDEDDEIVNYDIYKQKLSKLLTK